MRGSYYLSVQVIAHHTTNGISLVVSHEDEFETVNKAPLIPYRSINFDSGRELQPYHLADA